TVITFRKTHFVYNATLLLPVLLYGLMLCSLAWSIDSENTIKALSKEIPLLLIPIAFMMFPAFSTGQRKMIVKWYSWGIFAYCVFYLIKAVVRFAGSGEESVFFYHELVTKDVNAIHVSVYVAVAFMWFFTKSKKSIADIVAATLLFAMVFLLSSKNIIIAFIALVVIHQLF